MVSRSVSSGLTRLTLTERFELDFLTAQAYIETMNKLFPAKRAAIVSALVEGNSIRATCRMTDTAKGTVLKLLVDLGRACESWVPPPES